MEISANTPAVVTGGASGLGEATARALAAKGAKVAIFDLQEEKGRKVAEDIGGIFCEVNVTSDESVEAGFAKAREAHGQERILVNCAGVGNAMKTVSRSKEDGTIRRFPSQAFDWVVQINLVGSFRCISYFAEGLLAADPLPGGESSQPGGGRGCEQRGVIINTASVAAEDGQIGQAAYSASKGGVLGHDAADRARFDERRRPRQHDPAGHFRNPAAARSAATRPGRARRCGAVPQASRPSRRIRAARAGDDRERLLER